MDDLQETLDNLQETLDNLQETLDGLLINCCITGIDQESCKCCKDNIKYIHIICGKFIYLFGKCIIGPNGSIRGYHFKELNNVQDLINYMEIYYPEYIKNQDIKIALK